MHLKTISFTANVDGTEIAVVITLRDGYSDLPIPRVLVQSGGNYVSPSTITVEHSH